MQESISHSNKTIWYKEKQRLMFWPMMMLTAEGSRPLDQVFLLNFRSSMDTHTLLLTENFSFVTNCINMYCTLTNSLSKIEYYKVYVHTLQVYLNLILANNFFFWYLNTLFHYYMYLCFLLSLYVIHYK